MVARHHPPRPRPRPAPYLDKVRSLFPELPQPGVYVVRVSHDDDCPALRGRACRCNPDVSRGETYLASEDRGTA
jgi:hypothetical protein